MNSKIVVMSCTCLIMITGVCGQTTTHTSATCAKTDNCHESIYGCFFVGDRGSKEECATIGLEGNGRDLYVCKSDGSQLYNCNSCNVLIEGEPVYTEYCALMCGYCSRSTNGRWSDWSRWHDCTVLAGGGHQLRERQCNNPEPTGGGKDCVGNTTEVRACNQQDGWSRWHTCTVSCNGGNQLRERKCNATHPSEGGKECQGDQYEVRACNPQACPASEATEDSNTKSAIGNDRN